MAERRMFAKTIIDSDAFLDMPLSTQALYFHLSMRADDEGFINSPKKIQRMIGASDDDLKVLASKRFIIPFESGIVVIKHWRIHNYIRADRINETAYTEERAMLTVKDNGAYTLCQTDVSQLSDTCQSSGSIGKDSIDKDRLGKDRLGKRFAPPTIQDVKAYCLERNNGISPEAFISHYEANGWMVGKNPMKDWRAAVRYWETTRKKQKTQSFEEMLS